MAKEVENKKEVEFVNPFLAGSSYDEFAKAKGDKTVKEYLAGKFKAENEPFTDADIEWLEKELSNHNYNKENKEANLARARAEHAELVKINEKTIN